MRIFKENLNKLENCPIILTAPHGGREIPPELRANSHLSESELLATSDIGTDLLVSADRRFHSISANYARTIVDLNRSAHQLDSNLISGITNTNDAYARAGYGVIPRFAAKNNRIWQNQLSANEAQAVIKKFHRPFHDRLQMRLEEIKDQMGWALILDIHSAPETSLHGADIVLGNCHGMSCGQEFSRIIEHIFSQNFEIVVMNKPFSGGYITRHYGKPAQRVHVIQIEISRALIEDNFRHCKKEFLNQWSVILDEISEYFFETKPSRFAAE